MSKKIISAIGSDVIEKLLKEMLPEYEIAGDIPYQEGLFDILANSEYDILVLNVNIEGIYNKYGIIERIRELNSNMKIIVIYEKEDKDYRNFLFSKGIYDFLIQENASIEELIDIIKREDIPAENLQSEIVTLKKLLDDKPKVIKETKVCTKIQRQSVITISGDNGSGKSTIAANLAYTIAKNTSLKVLLIDFDTISGSIEEFFRVNKMPKKPEYILSTDKASSLNYMVDAIDKRIFDNNFFERYLVEVPNCKNLSLLTGNNSLYICQNVLNQEYYSKILDNAKSLYDYVIIDTSSNIFLDSTQFSLINSNKNFYVINPTYLSIKKAINTIDKIYKSWDVNLKNLSVIVNKYKNGYIDKNVVEELLGEYEVEYFNYDERYIKELNYGQITEKEEYKKLLSEFQVSENKNIFERIKLVIGYDN